MSAQPAGPTSHSFISQRLRLHYVDWGNAEAPPLVLVHGGQDHCRNWDWVAADLRRDVNDIGFDVALHIVFTDKPAHDVYQESPSHMRFIAENKGGWKQVRVFDSVVEQSPATA